MNLLIALCALLSAPEAPPPMPAVCPAVCPAGGCAVLELEVPVVAGVCERASHPVAKAVVKVAKKPGACIAKLKPIRRSIRVLRLARLRPGCRHCRE